ncbi:MAG: amidohydrolase family protein [Desulfobaccales bacterium]
MIAHVSKWVLPVDQPPIRDGAVVVAGDRIAAVGPADEVLSGFTGLICEHGHGAILPGVVNCHVHLEFSALAGRVAPRARWEDWLDATLAAYGALAPEEVEAGIGRGIDALWRSGAVLVGEVTNTGASWPHLARGPLSYHLFYECLGFNLLERFDLPELFPFFGRPEVAAAAWVSAAAHAPYSVSAALFRAVDQWNAVRQGLQMVHLAESRAELDFLAKGNGFCEGLLKRRGRWAPDFQPPGVSPPAYLNSLEFLGSRTLAVHGAWLNSEDCELLAGTGTWLVLCPPGQPVHRGRDAAGAGVAPGGGEPVPGHRLPGGQPGPESVRGNALAPAKLSRLPRGSLAAPGDPERRPGPGTGPGLRQSGTRETRGPGIHSPDGERGILGRAV